VAPGRIEPGKWLLCIVTQYLDHVTRVASESRENRPSRPPPRLPDVTQCGLPADVLSRSDPRPSAPGAAGLHFERLSANTSRLEAVTSQLSNTTAGCKGAGMPNVWSGPRRQGVVARARVTCVADVRAIERIPYLELLPRWSILGVIEQGAAQTPDKAAFVVLDKDDPARVSRQVTYAELAALVRATANRLHAISGSAPPVVSILTPLAVESFIASWAAATVGIANPINPFLRIEHVASIMNAAGTTVLVCGAAADGPGAWNDLAKLRAMVPTLRHVWSLDHASGSHSFQRQIGTAPQDCLMCEPADPDQTAALLHTGGTTATPKLVRLTERGMLLNAWCCATFNGNGSDEVVAVGMPYFHVAGAMVLALAALVFGQTMVIVSPEGYRSSRVITRFWDLVDTHGVTLAGSAPTTAAAIVASCSGRRAPAGFGYWAGGATVPIQVAREFADKFGVPLREGWGMTELQGALALNPSGIEPRLGSTGFIFPYHRARCVPLGARSADDDLAPGAVGVLAISGPCVTQGYLDSTRSSELFLDSSVSGEKWLNTGDLCTIDAEGYVWLRGRSKDLIIRGGHNIDPIAIEAVLAAHPAVLYAAAIGEPDRDKGELPVAYVQLRSGFSVSESDLRAHCQHELSERAAVPCAVRIIEAMPLTAVGKIFKPALRVDAIRHCVRRVADQLAGAGAIGVEVRDAGGTITVVLTPPHPSKTEAFSTMRRELERYTFRVEVEPAPIP
jgi:fatty-acyl-CoA synthase